MTEKADQLMASAAKKRDGFTFFGGTQKFEEAAEMFTEAGNAYKMAKDWKSAWDAFKKAADCQLRAQSRHDACQAWISASVCYKKCDVSAAIECLKLAVDSYCNIGKFSMAAKHQKEIAEIYEAELDLDSAIAAYRQAADYFSGEDSTSSANACLLKVAQFSAQNEKYAEAIEIYEKCAAQSVDNNLLKWSVKDYLLKAGLCHLCVGDTVTTQKAFERYENLDATFSSTRECKFLKDVLATVVENDVEAFTQVVMEFDSVSKLDNWKTSVLLKIKNGMKNEQLEGGNAGAGVL